MELGELRIGNWILFDDEREEQVTLKTFCSLSKSPELHFLFDGIQLTEEWLLKFGFKHEGIGWRMDILKGTYHFKEISIAWCNDRGLGEWYFFFRDGTPNNHNEDHIVTITRELRFVHELQNIYYSITKKELTLNI